MDNKDFFDEAIGDPPPSTVDMDFVVLRGRRSVLLRQVVSPVIGVAAAVVLVVVAAAVLPFRGQADHGVATVPSETTSAPSASPAGPTPPAPSGTCAEQAAQIRQWLTTATRELVGERLVSGEELTAAPAARDNAGTGYGPLEFFQKAPPAGTGSCEDSPDYLAHANAEIADLAGSVSVTVSRSSLPLEPCPSLDRDLFSCQLYSGPADEQILARSERGEHDSIRNIVRVNKEGSSIEITASNAADSGTPASALPLSPLDVEQLVEIALDSRIALP